MCVGEVFVELGELKVHENNIMEEEEKHFESRFETITHLKPHLG